jgi:hypothetical protein
MQLNPPRAAAAADAFALPKPPPRATKPAPPPWGPCRFNENEHSKVATAVHCVQPIDG